MRLTQLSLSAFVTSHAMRCLVSQCCCPSFNLVLLPSRFPSLPQAQVKALYDAKLSELRSANRREDFSDMVAAKAAQQKRKMAAQQEAKGAKKAKGGDTFKF